MPVGPVRGPATPSVKPATTGGPTETPKFQPGDKTSKIGDFFDKARRALRVVGAEIEADFNPWKHLSSWEVDSQKMAAAVARSSTGQAQGVADPAFLTEMESLTGARFHQGAKVSVLADGPQACDAWVDGIQSAKTSVHMQSWAFYDDATGGRVAEALVQKAKEGVDVRVMVDGQIGEGAHHKPVLEYMEQNGVKVVRWRNPDREYCGLHSKVLVVDGAGTQGKVFAGGRNVADKYFDTNPDGPKWRDTDMAGDGPMATDAEALFARRWNDQVSKRKELDLDAVAAPPPAQETPGKGARVMVVGNEPKIRDQSDDKILLATLKAIQGAQKSFDIENAYFVVQSPENRDALREALIDALQRGVKVRVFTNSDKTVNEPALRTPILNSAIQMANAGAEVYLKQGDLLHSKYWVADGEMAMVSSYNNHPRSHYYEAESAMVVADKEFASSMVAHFEQGAAEAKLVAQGTPPKPESFGSRLGKLFLNQL
ncbi:MAG: phosphatidylserine/phosphatidylglycerophosphate/cardiolipin synthase family protein [Deltaproteobacteria bacterium]|nr:phosphatidylserine/phosphatidylglycerophosphate/cardiolipin synthase family protein [Deltaproteobacteria bacterium]